MSGRSNTRIGRASKRASRTALLAVGAILIGGSSVPSASADLVKAELVKEVTDTVGSTVRSVQAGAESIPSPPSSTTPAKPSKPSSPVPPPQASVGPPSSGSAPSPPQADTGSRAKSQAPPPPSADGVAGTVRSTVDPVTGIGSEAVYAPATSERSHSGTVPAAVAQDSGGAGAGKAIVRERRTQAGSAAAVRAGEVAPLQRWLARVWPAVALGGIWDGEVGEVEVLAGAMLRPAFAAVAGLLLASSPILPASGDAPLAGQQGVAGASRSAPASSPSPSAVEGGWKIVYLIAIGVLLALLAFTVWREFRVALHPGLH